MDEIMPNIPGDYGYKRLTRNLVPALCLDWDGTIRRSKSGFTFIKDKDDIELIPGMEEIIWVYRNLGWLIIGISNQGAVAFGIKTVPEIRAETKVTLGLFKTNPFHIVKMCMSMTGGTTEPYNHRSLMRKPYVGMLAAAEQTAWENGHIIDWDKSLFVGDRPEDQSCARNADIPFIYASYFLNHPPPPHPNLIAP